jgi:hypothetical protein
MRQAVQAGCADLARSKLRSLTAASTTSTSTTITAFTCASRASCARFPVPLALDPHASDATRQAVPRAPSPCDLWCGRASRSVMGAASPADVVMGGGRVLVGAAVPCGAMRCGAVQDEKPWAAGTHMGTCTCTYTFSLITRMRAAGPVSRAKRGELTGEWS